MPEASTINWSSIAVRVGSSAALATLFLVATGSISPPVDGALFVMFGSWVGLTAISMIPAAIVARTSRDDGADDPTNKGVNAGMIGVAVVSVLVWLGSAQV